MVWVPVKRGSNLFILTSTQATGLISTVIASINGLNLYIQGETEAKFEAELRIVTQTYF